MTKEKSTRFGGHQVVIEKPVSMKKSLYGGRNYYEYVQSGGNYIRKEYDWDKSYML